MTCRLFLGWLPSVLASLFSLCLASTIACAGAVKLDKLGPDLDKWCADYSNCVQLFEDIVRHERARRLRLVEDQPVEMFDTANPPATCRMSRPLTPTYFALVIAPGYEDGMLPALKSNANDAAYYTEILKERGVAADRIVVLAGADVSRDGIIRSMRETLACIRNSDQLFFAFTGHATMMPLLAEQPLERVVRTRCEEVSDLRETGLCEKGAQARKSWKQLDRLYGVDNAVSVGAGQESSLVVLTNYPRGETYQDWQSGRRRLPGLLSIELANFVNQVRNLDADIFVLIDASHAAAARIAEQTERRFWSWTSDDADRRIRADSYDVRLTGRGQLGVFYAVGPQQPAFDRNESRLGQVGMFSYLFSESLRKLSSPTMTELAAEIRSQYAAQTTRAPQPVIHATSPNLIFMPASMKIEPNERDIEIIQPALKRSAQILTPDATQSLTLVARYVGKGKPYKVIIDSEVVDIDVNGQFRKTVDDALAKGSIDIRVISSSLATLSYRVLSLKMSDQDIILSSAGRKLALFIANQDYEDDRFNDLRTPKADAEAVRRILTESFGFATEIVREDGSKLDLNLVNATRGDISRALFELRKRLTKEDELIIYYAGHGDTVEGAGSYWIPVDGKYDEYFDWIDSNDITTELRLMNAGAILLISDSCYSGGLARGEASVAPSTEARERYLARARGFKTRQLIASGGEEPVADGEGGSHSIFAKALIDSLAAMPDQAFTASELLEQKVKPAVISVPSAVSERQIPGFHRIAKAGDEIGSEFIFVRKDAARQASAP
ncbi:MAG: caspase domain-containing protein [Parvibaculaceae bacterium]